MGNLLAMHNENVSDYTGDDQDEIEEEMEELLELNHPLRDKSIYEIFPVLRWFKKDKNTEKSYSP